MDGTTDDLYFEWLYGQIAAITNRNPSRSFWELTRQLYAKEFTWSVPNDDNRLEDGKELRDEFLRETDIPSDPNWYSLGCSTLELLIALARMAAFETGDEAIEWFWKMIANMGLTGANDSKWSNQLSQYVDEAVNRVIYRTYSADGIGGLFPIPGFDQDLRNVELWYQLSAYILEDGSV